jgi:hypothetical protein
MPQQHLPLSLTAWTNTSIRFFFRGTVGVMDGTHIACSVPVAGQLAYRHRKGTLNQNVVAVVDFNQLFTYALRGWEGSAHDARVLNEARASDRFGGKPSEDNYYLASNTRFTLMSYCGTCYYSKEWLAATHDQGPVVEEKLFNPHYSSRRNVGERAFGVFKMR